VTDFTPQASYAVEIQFSERMFLKKTWEMQRALSEITLWAFCLLLVYKNVNGYGNEKFEGDIFCL